jgi:hypothetical protein
MDLVDKKIAIIVFIKKKRRKENPMIHGGILTLGKKKFTESLVK